MLAVLGGIAILFVASAYQPQIYSAVRSAWSRFRTSRVHNETTSTDGPQTAAQQRTLFTTSQQNLNSKSATSNRLDRRIMSQVDQILASITDYESVQKTQSSPALEDQSQRAPEIQRLPVPQILAKPAVLSNHESYVLDPVYPAPYAPNSTTCQAAASKPSIEPSAPSALIDDAASSTLATPSTPLISQHSLRIGSKNVNYPCKRPTSQNSLRSASKKSSTSVDLSSARQPEVTSLFSGNPCAPPITTFAPSIHGFSFSLTNPPTKKDPDLYAHTVDVNELVAALAANPNLKSPPKCTDHPTTIEPIESIHDTEYDHKMASAMSPTYTAEKHVSICLSTDQVNKLSSSVLGSNSITKVASDSANDKTTYCFSSHPQHPDLESLLSSENKKLHSSTTFTSAETDLSFDSVKVDCQQHQPIHETTSALRLQAPVPPVSSETMDLASKSATSQPSNTKIGRHSFEPR